MNDSDSDTTVRSRGSSTWYLFGSKLPRAELVYFSQIFAVYMIIIASLVNLSIGSKPTELYITLLSSCVGFILPSPQLEYGRGSVKLHSDNTI